MTPVTAVQAAAIERRIAEVEAVTGIQIVAAVVPRADDYPELPWRAFALGAALSGLIALAIDVGRPDWLSAQATLMQTLAILAGGALAGLAAARIPQFSRIFLGARRARAEARQCAESLFLTHELFATPRRDAVLVMVSQFERRVVVVPDVHYRGRVTHGEWETVVESMTPKLREGSVADAFAAGLSALEALLGRKGIAPDNGEGARANALPDMLLGGPAS